MEIVGVDKNGDEIAKVSVSELDAMFVEVRNKAIDEFAEVLRLECLGDPYKEIGLHEILKLAVEMKKAKPGEEEIKPARENEFRLTRNDLLRSDGVMFNKYTFEESDGITVPVVWNDMMYDPTGVIGIAVLKNCDDGVFATLTFNDSENGIRAKELLDNGEAEVTFSGNIIKRTGALITSGYIRAVHLVMTGCGFTYKED